MEILIVMIIFSTMTVSLFSLMNYAQKFFQENLAEETIKDQVSYAMSEAYLRSASVCR